MATLTTGTPTPQRTDVTKHGEVVAAYDRYADAQRAVDQLSDEGFPVEHLSIVSEGLRLVEHVTGRRGYGRAALEGAGTGAVLGAVLGVLFGLFSVMDPVVAAVALAIWWLVLGAAAGAVFGLVSHALKRGRRDFGTVDRIEASSYQVLADPQVAARVRRQLGTNDTAHVGSRSHR